MVTARERTFGFELEVAEGAPELSVQLRSAGLAHQGRVHQYHCRCEYCDEYFGQQGNWLKVQNDSSCGGEVISSILRWENTGDTDEMDVNPTRIIDGLTRILVESDTPIDHRCGLHVHVGATDLSDNQLGRLYALMHHHEAILYRLACGRRSEHRGYNNNFDYCRPMSAFDNPVEARELARLKSAQVKSSPIAYNKYIAANMMPIERLGTVEFRLWESTRSRRRLRFYIKLSIALVQRAKRRRNPVGTFLPLGAEGTDDDFLMFLTDLQETVPELVDDEFIEDAHWQWEQAPARWQRGVSLSPLPHHLMNGSLATGQEDEVVVEQYDSHGRPVHVPFEYDLERQAREEAALQRNRGEYRQRLIPPEYRDARVEQPNYDCGYGYCTDGPCQNNREMFWSGVAVGNIRQRQPRRRPSFRQRPDESGSSFRPPEPEAPPIRLDRNPVALNQAMRRAADRARERAEEGWRTWEPIDPSIDLPPGFYGEEEDDAPAEG